MQEVSISNSNKKIIVDDIDFLRTREITWQLTHENTGRDYISSTIANGISGGKTISIGRFILEIFNSKLQVDHKDRNIFHNWRTNLRVCTFQQNQCNRRGVGDYYKGVSKNRGYRGFSARIKYKNKVYSLGSFDTEEQAAKAYDKKAFELNGEFAYLNFPGEIL